MDTVPDGAFEETEVTEGVYLAQLTTGERMSLQHVRMEPGARVPDHDHHHEQAGFVYAGELTFRLDGGEITVEAGDTYHLAGDERHGAVNRGDEVALAVDVFGPSRPDPDWLD
jgi:quercetin dioxygenase-like cupin family protein